MNRPLYMKTFFFFHRLMFSEYLSDLVYLTIYKVGCSYTEAATSFIVPPCILFFFLWESSSFHGKLTSSPNPATFFLKLWQLPLRLIVSPDPCRRVMSLHQFVDSAFAISADLFLFCSKIPLKKERKTKVPKKTIFPIVHKLNSYNLKALGVHNPSMRPLKY